MNAPAASPRTAILVAPGIRLVLTAMLGRTIAASLRAHRQHTEIEVVFACQSGDCSSLQLKADALWVGLTCFGLHGKRDAVHAFLTANGIAFEDER